jgi:hypothetical protein
MIEVLSLAAVLVVQPTELGSRCSDDDRCKARRSEQRAEGEQDPDKRALFLQNAHRSYLFLFRETGDPEDLCASRRAFDASLAVPGQSTDQRTSTEDLRHDLEVAERGQRPRCTSNKRRARNAASPPVVAIKGPQTVRTSAAPAPPVPSEPPALQPVAPGPMALRSSTLPTQPTPSPSARPVDDTLMPVPARRSAAGRPPSGRGLLVAGGLSLGVGVALATAAGVLRHRMPETRREYFTVIDSIDGYATPDQNTRADALANDYRVMGRQSLALGLAGGATIVVAAVLAGVGGRRMARVATRAALVPVPGGLALHARF